MATGQRGGGRYVSWTVPLRYWEARLLDAMFAVVSARAGQRVSRAQWLIARALVLLRAASADDALPSSTRVLAERALTDYERGVQAAQHSAAQRQRQPAWDALTR